MVLDGNRESFSADSPQGQFVLDDYKFDRDPTHQILAEIEEHLSTRT